MYKFMDREKALSIINKWIREGSKLESWGKAETYECFALRGQDGSYEEFYIFNDIEDYNKAIYLDAWEF